MPKKPSSDTIFDKRVDIVMLASCTNSLYQGDPDADNEPRVDPETGHGYSTPQGIKRKIRDFAALKGEKLFIVRDEGPLATKIKNADKKDKKAVQNLCETYWDIRTFGGVITNPVNEPITGPVQISFGETVDEIDVINPSITRCVVTKESEKSDRTMGRMSVCKFGLYVHQININPFYAMKTGFTYGDFELFLESLVYMFEISKSTTRSQVHLEKAFVFTHGTQLGDEGSHKLRRRVKISRFNPNKPPRSMEDYDIQVDEEGLKVDLRVIEG